ncbi:rCG52032 [Rattus norvegicus]|uniref:RCG52032 n=1 Tax=Rattus norvegicus TaxID=10116 RepID=A6K2X2_RAT|nr:rCG52032 [Rattus norvegicus]
MEQRAGKYSRMDSMVDSYNPSIRQMKAGGSGV